MSGIRKFYTLAQVVEATLVKFEQAEALSTNHHRTCVYAHNYNGIGCAIGCHVTPKQATWLDARVGVTGAWTVDQIYRADRDARFILEKRFVGIDEFELRELQEAHDTASDVHQFRARLKHYLKHGKWDLSTELR